MNEHDFLISMFIDDELDLEEKIDFVEKVHGSAGFTEDTVSLLHQEQLLRTGQADPKPFVQPVPAKPSRFFAPRVLHTAAVAVATAVIVLSSVIFWQHGQQAQPVSASSHRFVICVPDARQVEITGSFTGWRKVALEKRGTGGYWEVTLPLPPGEHSFTYILDGSHRVADPTIPAGEMDDFGGENSILYPGIDA